MNSEKKRKLLQQYIMEVREDILLKGIDAKVIAIFDRKTSSFQDYIHYREDVDYIDEQQVDVTLLDLLAYLLAGEYQEKFNAECCMIKATRLILDLSQSEFAQRIEESIDNVCSWEQMRRIPKLDILLKCIKALNCSYDLFFNAHATIKNLEKKKADN